MSKVQCEPYPCLVFCVLTAHNNAQAGFWFLASGLVDLGSRSRVEILRPFFVSCLTDLRGSCGTRACRSCSRWFHGIWVGPRSRAAQATARSCLPPELPTADCRVPSPPPCARVHGHRRGQGRREVADRLQEPKQREWSVAACARHGRPQRFAQGDEWVRYMCSLSLRSHRCSARDSARALVVLAGHVSPAKAQVVMNPHDPGELLLA